MDAGKFRANRDIARGQVPSRLGFARGRVCAARRSATRTPTRGALEPVCGVPGSRAFGGSGGRRSACAGRPEAARCACAAHPEREPRRLARPVGRRAVGRRAARDRSSDGAGERVEVAQGASRERARDALTGVCARMGLPRCLATRSERGWTRSWQTGHGGPASATRRVSAVLVALVSVRP